MWGCTKRKEINIESWYKKIRISFEHGGEIKELIEL